MCASHYERASSPPALLLLPLFLLSSSPPLAHAAIQIPKDFLQPPILTKMPESYTAFSLDDIILPCEATGTPKPSFRWVKDGQKLNWMEHKGSGNFTANGDKPLSDYQGHYRCYADNTLGTAMTHTVKLITEPTPTLPKQKSFRKTAEEGDSVVLHCNPPKSSTIPHIHWMDKKLLHIGQSERVTTGLDGNLYFANVLKNDSRDDYTCHAQYIAARTILPKEHISLTVTPSNDVARGRKPHLMQPQGSHSSYLALRGHSLVLECIPKGLPTPSVMWKRMDGNLLETGARIENHGRWLQFDSITQEADGEYECLASNTHGSVTHTYTVTVEAEPYWVKEPLSLLYSPGETVRIDCQAEGIPTPTITWSMNGEPVTEVDIDPRRRVSGGVLILTDLVFSDTAVYQCEATNKHGNILNNTYIYVIELPAQILSSDGVVYKATEGGVARLHCEAFGSPRPQVTWESEDLQDLLLSDSRVSQLTNGTLELFNSSREDSGVYTCSITHSNISITAHLEVLNRTVMLIGPQAVRVRRGRNSWLDCHFTFDPQLNRPQILWRKDGHKIIESPPGDKYTVFENGTLRVTDVQSADGGLYSCEVITDLDSVMASGSITVVARPSPPVSLSLSEQQDRSLTLSWTPGHTHNSPTTEFVVEMREEQHSEGEGKWEEAKSVTGDVNNLELSLLPYSTYRFRVSGVNDQGRSNPSEPSETYSTPPAVPDVNPGKVRSESTVPGTLVIMWEELDQRLHNGPRFQYKVSWRQAQGREPHWSHTHVPGPPYLVNGTGAFSSYQMKVQAVNSLGEGPHPVPSIGHSGEDYPLASPSNISVSVANSSSSVRWQPVDTHTVQGHLLGYKIYLKRLGSQGGAMEHREESEMEGGVERGMEREEEGLVVVVQGSKTEETVTGLKLYSLYELSITTFNSKGEGPHSPTHRFSTPEGVPGPPASLGFESPSETELTLHWRPPIQPNGRLVGYVLQYQQISDSGDSPLQLEVIYDPTVTHFLLEGLDPHSRYVFYLRGRTTAGQGPPITRECATLLDGVPPSNISIVVGETSVNLSWVPGDRYRNHSFHIKYLSKTVGGKWEESEQVNTMQAFYSLTGLQPGTQYRLLITHGNYTHWEEEIQTTGPEPHGVEGDFATQGWFIGMISAVVLLMLLLLVLCFIKRSKGGKYAVKDKEENQMDSEARPMKDETFGEYRSLESDGDEKRSVSQPSLCVESKLGSDDSLAEYGDSVDIQFNEDGSFIGQYSGRGPAPTGNESSGPASPVNQDPPPPPIGPSFSGILDRPS
ncbi:neural cell adhesion molecule L1.1-like isoform X2 [Coregonus clupeaformis]|uniref:neural cell adhesion molecule L1.1-like isoform X2 n=1 Tax=Coregonus clupeaformis TaxID=59861 RepID=UPI001E1C7055|nr:neural cell adhesion molecule L1.1-like isoform X2 [Coregonus clupeaformis]